MENDFAIARPPTIALHDHVDSEPLHIAMGGGSLSGPLTGIGQYTRHLLEHLTDLSVQCHTYMNGSWLRPGEMRFHDTADRRSPGADTARPTGALSDARKWARTLLRHVPYSREAARILQSRRFKHGLRSPVALYHEPNFIPQGAATVPLVITAHDASWVRHPETHPRQRVAFMNQHFDDALARADRVIVVSEFVRGEMTSLFPASAAKLRVVHNGVSPRFRPHDLDVLRPYLQTLNLQPKSYFLALGTLEPRKRLTVALQAHQRLPAAMRARYPLVIAGQKGWLVNEFEAMVARDLRSGSVRMLGYVSDHDLPKLISGAMATVYCSIYEGFGLPPLESMACGVLPICSNRSAIPEVVGEAGVLLDPDHPEGFTHAMRQAIDDPAWVARLGVAGLTQAAQFSWSRCARETLRVYRELLTA